MRRRSLEERFWEKVNRSAFKGCWLWKGSTFHFGHGQFSVTQDGRRRNKKAHRVAWELTNGPIPDGLMVCHRCDNPPCVRPDHLYLGTAKDNHDDSWNKGRAFMQLRDDHPFKKLSDEQTLEALCLWEGGAYAREIAEYFGIARGSVWYVIERAHRLLGKE